MIFKKNAPVTLGIILLIGVILIPAITILQKLGENIYSKKNNPPKEIIHTGSSPSPSPIEKFVPVAISPKVTAAIPSATPFPSIKSLDPLNSTPVIPTIKARQERDEEEDD